MSTGLLEVMKRAAMDVNENSKPTDLRFGTVISDKPLKIRVTNQFVIPESMLIVPEYLTDHEIEVSVYPEYGWASISKSGGSGDPQYESHNHDIYFTKRKLFIHNALKVGDKVAMIRQAGGQHYLVSHRLVGDVQ